MSSLRLSCMAAFVLAGLSGCATVSRPADINAMTPSFSIAKIHVPHPLSVGYRITRIDGVVQSSPWVTTYDLKAGQHAIEITPKFQSGNPIHMVVHLATDHVYNVEFMRLYLSHPLISHERPALVLDPPTPSSTGAAGPSLYAATLRDEDTGLPAQLLPGPSSVRLSVNTQTGLRHVFPAHSSPANPTQRPGQGQHPVSHRYGTQPQPAGVGFTLNAEGMGCWNCSWVTPDSL